MDKPWWYAQLKAYNHFGYTDLGSLLMSNDFWALALLDTTEVVKYSLATLDYCVSPFVIFGSLGFMLLQPYYPSMLDAALRPFCRYDELTFRTFLEADAIQYNKDLLALAHLRHYKIWVIEDKPDPNLPLLPTFKVEQPTISMQSIQKQMFDFCTENYVEIILSFSCWLVLMVLSIYLLKSYLLPTASNKNINSRSRLDSATMTQHLIN